MKRAWTLAAAVVAVAVTTAVVFADQDQSSGVIFARSRTAKYSPLVPGVSSYVAWGDTAKGPFGGFTKFRPGYDAGMHTHTADVLLVVLRGAYLYREDRKSTRLNSSHSQISYAVFCLKKKNTKYATDSVHRHSQDGRL